MIQTNSAGCRGVRPIQATQSGIIRSQARDPLIPAIKFKLGGRVPPPYRLQSCIYAGYTQNLKTTKKEKNKEIRNVQKKTSATKKLHFAK